MGKEGFNALDFFPDHPDELRLWPKGVLPRVETPLTPDESDVVDGGDVVDGLVRGFVKTGSSIVTKPPKPVSSVSALPVWEFYPAR